MGVLKVAGGVIKSVVDVKGWLGYDQIKYQSKDVTGMIRHGFRIQKATYQETFEQAMTRLNLSAEDLQGLVHRFTLQMYLYIVCTVFALLYLIYLFWNIHLIAGVITLFIVALFIIKACAVNFYLFQIKHRKLGCTLKEWLDGKVTQDKEA